MTLHPFRSPLPTTGLALLLAAGALAAAPATAQPACTLSQITADPEHDSFPGELTPDGRWLTVVSEADHVGGNPDHSRELFLFDTATGELVQLTSNSEGSVHQPEITADGSRVFFRTEVMPPILSPFTEAIVELDVGSGVETELVNFRPGAHSDVSTDGSTVALTASIDPLGTNADRNAEVFLLDVGTGAFLQITDTVDPPCPPFPGICPANGPVAIDADAEWLALVSDLDLLGLEPDGGTAGGVYLYEIATGALEVVTFGATGGALLSQDGTAVAFPSIRDLTGDNPVGTTQLFVFDRVTGEFVQATEGGGLLNRAEALDGSGDLLAFSTVPQVGQGRDALVWSRQSGSRVPLLATPGTDDFPAAMTPDGTLIALFSKANRAGGNPDGSFEVFLASCGTEMVPEPPEDAPWLALPTPAGFRAKVRITPQTGSPVEVRAEGDCIAETLCVSGALPGRSELFVRIIGPRGNGRLWPVLTRFTPSRVEVWIEQQATGAVRYYRLDAVPRTSEELSGLIDREGFVPQ